MKKVRNRLFYEAGFGTPFGVTEKLTPGIKEFLQYEVGMLYQYINLLPKALQPDILVVLGSMWGLRLKQAIECKIGYLGVDLVYAHVAKGIERLSRFDLPQNRYYGFMHAHAEDLELILASELDWPRRRQKILSLYTFHSIGSMNDLAENLLVQHRLNSPFSMSAYNTSPEATKERIAYQTFCGYENVRAEEDEIGVHVYADSPFKPGLGRRSLHTIAYNIEHYMRIGKDLSMQLYVFPLGPLGNAITNVNIYSFLNYDHLPSIDD